MEIVIKSYALMQHILHVKPKPDHPIFFPALFQVVFPSPELVASRRGGGGEIRNPKKAP